ncbi:MAG: hypothetical protein ACO1N0_03410 [Fluviicola sp.]
MKLVILLLSCLFVGKAFSQGKNLLFEIDRQYIFADTTGKVFFDQRFNGIQNVIPGEYIVETSHKKFRVVKDHSYVFPFEFDYISVMKPTYHFHLYALRQGEKSALATTDGVIHTGFDYESVFEYSLHNTSQNKGINNDGFFFGLRSNSKNQLMYVSKSNKSVLLNQEPVDEIEDAYGMFVFKKGKQEAMFEFVPETISLKTIHPYADQSFGLLYDMYVVWEQKTRLTKEYSYKHKLLYTSKVPTVYENSGMESNQELSDVSAGVEIMQEPVDLERERKRLKGGFSENVFQAFQVKELHFSTMNEVLKFQAEFKIAGKKGDWLIETRYMHTSKRNRLKDTILRVAFDEVLMVDFKTTLLITRKGKLYGAIDSRGNEIFAPQFLSLERLRGENGEDWLLMKDGSESTLYFYDAAYKKVHEVLKGKSKDQFEFHTDYFIVTRPEGKKKSKSKLVHWIPPVMGGNHIIFDKNEFYDSITACELFPYFFNTSKGGQKGIMNSLGTAVIPCIYDSVCLNAYFFTRMSEYREIREYRVLQPIFSAFMNGKQQIYHPTNNEYSSSLLRSFVGSVSLSPSAQISDDGLFVIENRGNNLVDIYSIDGEKLSREPVLLNHDNRKLASFNEKYWYVRGKTAQNKDVLMGQNGAWFVLPDK